MSLKAQVEQIAKSLNVIQNTGANTVAAELPAILSNIVGFLDDVANLLETETETES